MKGKSFVAGLLMGTTVSGFITLLTTPNSGKETRIVIKNNAQPFIDQLSEIKSHLHELQMNLATATREGKETIPAFLQDIRKIITDWKKDIRPNQLHLQEEIASLEKKITEIEQSLNE